MGTYSQSNRILTDLSYLTNITQNSFEFRQVAGTAQRTLLLRFAPVYRRVRMTAQIEWIVLVVMQLNIVRQIGIAGLQDFPSLLRDFRSRTQFQKSFGERSCGFIVFELEKHVQSGPEGQDLMDGLQNKQ